MIADLNKMHDAGAITAHHFAVQCLHMLDPSEPELVLNQLPDEVLLEMQRFADSYDPNNMQTNYGIIPAQDQVAAARLPLRCSGFTRTRLTSCASEAS